MVLSLNAKNIALLTVFQPNFAWLTKKCSFMILENTSNLFFFHIFLPKNEEKKEKRENMQNKIITAFGFD